MIYFRLGIDECIEIQKNQELKVFFNKLSKYVENERTLLKQKKMIENNIVEPNFDYLNSLIEELKNLGITMDKTIFNFLKVYNIDNILDDLTFNHAHLNIFDLKKIINSSDNSKIIFNAETEYDLWSEKNKGIVTKINKMEAKITKLTKKADMGYIIATDYGNYHLVKSQLEGLKKSQKYGEQLNKSLEFAKSLTKEQALLINQIYEEIIKIKSEFDIYDSKNMDVSVYVKGKSQEIHENALNNMLNESLIEIDLTDIDIKLLKIFIVTRFDIPTTSFSKYDFDVDVVKWYINQRNENILELFNMTTTELDQMIKERYKKVKTIGGIK